MHGESESVLEVDSNYGNFRMKDESSENVSKNSFVKITYDEVFYCVFFSYMRRSASEAPYMKRRTYYAAACWAVWIFGNMKLKVDSSYG